MSGQIRHTRGMTALHLPFVAKVVGVSWHQDVVTQMAEGAPVVLYHQRDNPHDAHACVVETAGGVQLGYLPKAVARRLSERHAGGRWLGEISEVLPGHDCWGIRIRVLKEDESSEPGGSPVLGADSTTSMRSSGRPAEVRSKSGRVLGTLVLAGDGRVVVCGPNGVETNYPAHLVSVG
jgi:hypothetical protein